jgi:hypothetical protein
METQNEVNRADFERGRVDPTGFVRFIPMTKQMLNEFSQNAIRKEIEKDLSRPSIVLKPRR